MKPGVVVHAYHPAGGRQDSGNWTCWLQKEGSRYLPGCPALLFPCRTFALKRKLRYWKFSMNCTGTEAHISSCKLGPPVSRDLVKNATCESGQPVVVSCVPSQIFSPDGPSRFRKAYKPEVRTQQKVWVLGHWQG